MSDLLQFLWTSFFDYWRAWVTGTGVIGLLLAVVGIYERRRGRSIDWKLYSGLLLAVFWFCATFSAWHDAQKNLRAVINQRQTDTSALNLCTGDLSKQLALTESWKERFTDQQRIINGLQAPSLQQQATINACVTALAKSGSPEPLRITSFGMDVTTRFSGPPDYITGGILIAETNRYMPKLEAEIVCKTPFSLQLAQLLMGAMAESPSYQQQPGQTQLRLDFGTAWTAGQPIVAILAGRNLRLEQCVLNPST